MSKTVATLCLIVCALIVLGLVLVATASGIRGETLYGDPKHFVVRQLVWVVIALVAGLLVARFNYRNWSAYPWVTAFIFVGMLLLLSLVVTPGIRREINGSYRWLSLGPVNLQPSEFAKFLSVVGLSTWLAHINERVRLLFQGLILPGAVLAVIAGLLYLEPDYGSIMVIGLTSGFLLFIGGVRWIFLLPVIASGIVGGIALLMLDTNRARRIMEFFHDTPYQVKQSLLAFQFGGLTGVGFNNSIQKHKYLPEAHTDFIFAICGEEFGFIFSCAVIAAYIGILICGLIISLRARDRLGRLLAFGMTFLISFQAAWNIAMVLNCTITKGLALPFISYGGTNLVTAMAAIATLVNIDHNSHDQPIVRSSHLKL